MLYTFSQAEYDRQQLEGYLQQMQPQDALLLWQDGVVAGLKYASSFAQCLAPCYVLDMDCQARNLTTLVQQHFPQATFVSLLEVVELTEKYVPHFAL